MVLDLETDVSHWIKERKRKEPSGSPDESNVGPETDPAQEFSNSCLLKFCKGLSGSVGGPVSRCDGLVRLFRCQRVLKGFKGPCRAF